VASRPDRQTPPPTGYRCHLRELSEVAWPSGAH
jgi:hypothetical protein